MLSLKARLLIGVCMLMSGLEYDRAYPADHVSRIALGQGIMAGSVTPVSVILQTRLTNGTALIDGDLPGAHGIACFELSDSEDFNLVTRTNWQKTSPDQDYIIKVKINNLKTDTRYYYRVLYGPDQAEKDYSHEPHANWLPDPKDLQKSDIGTFKTLAGGEIETSCQFVVTTGWNYHHYKFGYYGNPKLPPYDGPDKQLGYPALVTILAMKPDFFIGTGDNVYYDHPNEHRLQDIKTYPIDGWYGNAKSPAEIRRKYHEQFVMQRWHDLFRQVPTFWEVDDHDYRFDDSDPYMFAARYRGGDGRPSHVTGIRIFKEQLPVTDPMDPDDVTYKTIRVNKYLQLWFIEGRFYRSPNLMPDGPEKSLWGIKQREWLKSTLKQSDALYKLIIHPTPLIGPSYAGKIDNHTSKGGFLYEKDQFFQWLVQENLASEVFFIVGDSHWKYHAKHIPTGLEEFACGSPVQANSGGGEKMYPGDPEATGSKAEICHLFHPREPYPGFLFVRIEPQENKKKPKLIFSYYHGDGKKLYEVVKSNR